jgi:predicted nucleotidyltransferase
MGDMKACGIVVEYNPFHNGHKFHAQEARKKSGAEVVVAVMSGNFLQRGEPAIIDKWQRARGALENGVDLVVELPPAWSVQSADFFAKGAVKILHSLGCSSLCFGTDAPEPFDYEAFARFEENNQELIDQLFQENASENQTYTQKMHRAFAAVYPEFLTEARLPNHILGMRYAWENLQYPTPMKLFPIPRKQAAYHSQELPHGEIASATAIRQAVKSGQEIQAYVPQSVGKDLLGPWVDWETFWPLLQYQLIATPLEQLKTRYQVTEGLEYRIKDCLHASSFADFMALLKTKRYTRARLQRLMCYLLFQATSEEVHQAQKDTGIRILGFTPAGQSYLKQVKKASSLPLLSKFGKKESERFGYSLRVDQIYQLASPKIAEQNFGCSPIFLKN